MSSDPRKVIKKLNSEINRDLGSFFSDLEQNLRQQTPIDEGRARRGWRKTGSVDINSPATIKVIENRVPYIGVLDTGTSKQALNGIVTPAIKKTGRGTRT